MAGLWQQVPASLRRDDSSDLTHTIITTSANEIVRPVHPDRMPVILRPEDYETWLNGSPDQAQSLLQPFPSQLMRIAQEGIALLVDEGRNHSSLY